jgi:hypothetical protein
VLPLVPDINDDDSMHSNDTYSDSYLEDFVHGFEKVVQPDEESSLEL